jgi:hypothetical protein
MNQSSWRTATNKANRMIRSDAEKTGDEARNQTISKTREPTSTKGGPNACTWLASFTIPLGLESRSLNPELVLDTARNPAETTDNIPPKLRTISEPLRQGP